MKLANELAPLITRKHCFPLFNTKLWGFLTPTNSQVQSWITDSSISFLINSPKPKEFATSAPRYPDSEFFLKLEFIFAMCLETENNEFYL